MEEEHGWIIAGVIAGFGGMAAWFKSMMSTQSMVMRTQADATKDLALAIKELRDQLRVLNAPTREEHGMLADRVNAIAIRQAQIGTELEGIRRRETEER